MTIIMTVIVLQCTLHARLCIATATKGVKALDTSASGWQRVIVPGAKLRRYLCGAQLALGTNPLGWIARLREEEAYTVRAWALLKARCATPAQFPSP